MDLDIYWIQFGEPGSRHAPGGEANKVKPSDCQIFGEKGWTRLPSSNQRWATAFGGGKQFPTTLKYFNYLKAVPYLLPFYGLTLLAIKRHIPAFHRKLIGRGLKARLLWDRDAVLRARIP